MRYKIFLFSCVISLFCSCIVKPKDYSPTSVPSAPDYSQSQHWAALPTKPDMADLVPGSGLKDHQNDSQVDVFFLHPTTYTRKGNAWNASLSNTDLNKKTDETTIKYQASIFNGAGKVYAPRYRQAHLTTFKEFKSEKSQEILAIAYEDLKSAFEYYLKHYNQKRPIIIASHSQGALHAKKLLKEYFDNKPLQRQLVAAYIVGWAVLKDEFKSIRPCESPEDTGCICSWRTFKYGHLHPDYLKGDSILVTNPLSWETNGKLVEKRFNKGAVLTNFNEILPGICDAKVEQGFLWAHKPKFPGSIFFNRKNYHVADFNLFYIDVRENAYQRVNAFWK